MLDWLRRLIARLPSSIDAARREERTRTLIGRTDEAADAIWANLGAVARRADSPKRWSRLYSERKRDRVDG